MGGGYSLSESASATSGNKVGPVTFGGVSFGNSGGSGGSSSSTWWILGGVAAAALGLFFFLKK